MVNRYNGGIIQHTAVFHTRFYDKCCCIYRFGGWVDQGIIAYQFDGLPEIFVCTGGMQTNSAAAADGGIKYKWDRRREYRDFFADGICNYAIAGN